MEIEIKVISNGILVEYYTEDELGNEQEVITYFGNPIDALNYVSGLLE